MSADGPAPRGAAWQRAIAEHRKALGDFVDLVRDADAERWRRAPAPGTWSPAQVAEHLVLVYEGLLRELAGAGPMAARVGRWQQRLLRWILLPHILFHRSFPLRARSPREARPSEDGLERGAAAELLASLAERFEREIQAAAGTGRTLTHPYFGPISPLRTLRFCAVHLEHHRRQLRDLLANPGR